MRTALLVFTGTALFFAFLSVACSNPADSGSRLPSLEGTVFITGIPRYGETLTAVPNNVSNPGDLTFQWRRTYADGSTANVGTGPRYTLRFADRGNRITVVAFHPGYSSAIRSAPLIIDAYQQDPDDVILISFTDIQNGAIPYIYIYFGGPKKIITLLEPEQYVGNIEWWFWGIIERSLGVDDGVFGYHNESLVAGVQLIGEYWVGTHFLTIKVQRDGVSYSKLIELRFRL